MEIDPELVVPDPSLSIGEGAILPWAASASSYYEQITQAIAERYEIDLDTPWEDLPDGAARPVPVRHQRRPHLRHLPQPDGPQALVHDDASRASSPTSSAATARPTPTASREKIEEYMSVRPCPACKGARLRPESRAVLVGGHGDPRVHARCRRASARSQWLDEVELTETERQIARLILREIEERLRFLDNVGVGYLSLDRAAATLSGGEAQRIRLATQIGSTLVGVLYILDEPSIGLHQRDNAKLIATLERLRDLGNTVIVVEHDEDTMRAADHLVDLGPGAGEHGGARRGRGHRRRRSTKVARVADRPVPGRHAARSRCPRSGRKPTGYVEIEGARAAQPQEHRRARSRSACSRA